MPGRKSIFALATEPEQEQPLADTSEDELESLPDAQPDEAMDLESEEASSEGEGDEALDEIVEPVEKVLELCTKSKSQEVQAKNWFFTFYPRPMQIALPDPDDWEISPEYLVYNTEICPQTGRRHFQGCVMWPQKVRRTQIFRMIGKCWCQPLRSPAAAAKYCSKEATRMEGTEPFVYGEPPKGQGARTDVDAWVNAVQNGASDLELVNEFPSTTLRFQQRLVWLRSLKAHELFVDDKPQAILVLGPSDLGKTTFVWAEARALADLEARPPPYKVKIPAKNSPVWWDGYTGIEDAVFDDASARYFQSANDFTTTVDFPRTYVKTHGAMNTKLGAKRLWFSSNRRPSVWWPSQETVDPWAIVRRFDIIYFFFALGRFVQFNTDDESRAWTKFVASPFHDIQADFEAHAFQDRNLHPDTTNARSRWLRA